MLGHLWRMRQALEGCSAALDVDVVFRNLDLNSTLKVQHCLILKNQDIFVYRNVMGNSSSSQSHCSALVTW